MILDLNVAQLKEELVKRGVKPSSKFKKTDLQKALKEAVKQVNEAGKSATEEGTGDAGAGKKGGDEIVYEDKSETQSKGKKKGAKGKRKRVEKSVDEQEEGTKKARKDLEKSKSDLSTPKKKTVQDKINEQNMLKWMVEKEGTKLGNLMIYLKQLWEENPSVKVIIFSQFPRVLEQISILLEEKEIDFSLVEGNSVKRNKRLNAFKAKDSNMHVLLLNINHAASGTNIVEASHIILMEPIQASNAQAIEAQAIARAHRQGQTAQVTVTRFVVRGTVEYEAYLNHYGKSALPEEKDTNEIFVGDHTSSGRAKMQRTSSLLAVDDHASDVAPIKFDLSDENINNNNNDNN